MHNALVDVFCRMFVQKTYDLDSFDLLLIMFFSALFTAHRLFYGIAAPLWLCDLLTKTKKLQNNI